MKCQEKECAGSVNLMHAVFLQTGCGGMCTPRAPAYPCRICGLLHWRSGHHVENRGGDKAFYDYAKHKITYCDKETGKIFEIS